MKFTVIATAIAAAITVSAVAVPAKQPKLCKNPQKRVEWRQLDASDQQGYLDAVLCLKTKPSRRGLNTPLYDDFAHLHFELNTYIHGGAPFLPWHRYFSKVYEDALRECGYDGPGTYWDWTLDNDGLRHSPVMASKRGFGGNGNAKVTEPAPGGGSDIKCVTSGPFKKLRPIYLGVTPTEMSSEGHCLWRNLPEVSEPEAFSAMAPSFSSKGVANVMAARNWTKFAPDLEGGPHGAIHASLGGDMNPTTSPNEPLFFLHHPQIDRIWWMWQQKDSKRLKEYSGKALHYGEKERTEVSLNDTLRMGGIAKDVKVADVMDTRSEVLCYTY